jgi:RpiR family carbohydrate utilization transcriptional regulator
MKQNSVMNLPDETSFQPSARLRAELGRLPEAERRVAELLLAEPASVVHESVGRLAQRAGASPATIVRLSRRLGYDGFAALKIALAQEGGRVDQFGHPRPATEERYLRVMEADAASIRDGATAVDGAAMAAAATAMAQAGEVLFCGVGVSAALAALSAFRLSALGIRASTAADPLSQHLRAATLGATDMCVAISHTGESRDPIEAVVTAARAGARTIGVTSFAGSPLTEAVALALVCTSEHSPEARKLFANPVALVSVLGALHAEVAARRPASDAGGAAARVIASHQY